VRSDPSGAALSIESPAPSRSRRRWRGRLRSVELLAAVVVAAILLRGILVDLVASPQASSFATVFVSVVVAGLPFVVLGALMFAAVTAVVPRGVVAGPPGLAALDRLLSPSTETTRGGALLAGVTFLLASPAANPVVLAATAVAFPGEPMMVLARFVAGVTTTAAIAGLWLALARRSPVRPAPVVGQPNAAVAASAGWPVFWERCRIDVIRAGGVLVVGAFAVAVLTVWLPPPWLDAVASSGLFAVVAMALLAVLLSVRAGADAFVAAALIPFPATAQLAFLVVGPVANLGLFNRQVARLGPRFAVRFAGATVGVGVLISLAIGWVLL